MSENSGNGTIDCYYVEAKHDGHEPRAFGKQIFDGEWRRVWFDRGIVGVPNGSAHYAPILDMAGGYYGYEAAQALRWWFHASAAVGLNGICLQTRIVKCFLKYSYAVERDSEHCVIGGDNRSNFMPDWGKKETPHTGR